MAELNENPNGRVLKGSVLFVDDEQNILASLKRLFRNADFEVFTAQSGADGLDILVKHSIDVVVSDMRMPEMDGAQFLKMVSSKWPDTIRMLLTGFADLKSTVDAINDSNIYRYISKPWEDNDIKLTIQHALERKFLEKEHARLEVLTRKQNQELADLNASLENKVKARTSEIEQMMDMLDTAHEELKKHYATTIKVFSNLTDMRDGRNPGHARRIADLARRLARKLDLDEQSTKDIMFAGLLHGIGKLGFPDEILNKPFNDLTQKERETFSAYPSAGEGLLLSLEPLHAAATIIGSHRESFDGHGYPRKLKGEVIPLGARVLSIAVDYSAYQIGRIMPTRLTPGAARDQIVAQRGKHYDPKLVELFLQVLDDVATEEKREPVVVVKSSALKAGMVLAQDLVTKDGLLLLSKGYAFDNKLINKLHTVEQSLGGDLEIFIKPGTPVAPPTELASGASTKPTAS